MSKDLIGQKFGRLTVIAKSERSNGYRTYWLCRCDCGNMKEVRNDSFGRGNTRSCGCLSKDVGKVASANIISMKFGKLTVVEKLASKNDGYQWWLCECDCGNKIETRGAYLHRGRITDCGCVDKMNQEAKSKESSEPKVKRKGNFTPQAKDETGKKYGRLTVIRRSTYVPKNGQACWDCECECGNSVMVSGTHLRTGHTTSCGCVSQAVREMIHHDLTGHKYGHWTVLGLSPERRSNQRVWLCQCNCGVIGLVSRGHLITGHSKSCGCSLNRKRESIKLEEGTLPAVVIINTSDLQVK